MSLNLEVAVAEVDAPSFTLHLEHDNETGSIDFVVSNENGDETVLAFIDEDGVLQLERLNHEEIDEIALSGLSFNDDGFLEVNA